MSEERKLIATNKKARFNYSVEESIECGVVLEGTEVKSVKAGSISVFFFEEGKHFLKHFRRNAGRCGIIGINKPFFLHFFHPLDMVKYRYFRYSFLLHRHLPNILYTILVYNSIAA